MGISDEERSDDGLGESHIIQFESLAAAGKDSTSASSRGLLGQWNSVRLAVLGHRRDQKPSILLRIRPRAERRHRVWTGQQTTARWSSWGSGSGGVRRSSVLASRPRNPRAAAFPNCGCKDYDQRASKLGDLCTSHFVLVRRDNRRSNHAMSPPVRNRVLSAVPVMVGSGLGPTVAVRALPAWLWPGTDRQF